jgi:alkanesulfonate monooxygenase SsuD/methylene tetrahydromethanopterin reductase-like flavin-dependent oxidoreductase (luciferase family)
LLELAPLADHWNIACIWVGDPRGEAANSDDSYVTAAAAALAAVTTDIRLGLVLSLRDERQLPRIAEDAAVIDQASHGRVELALREGGGGWTDAAARFLRAWNAWQLPGRDETVAVIPGPLQSVIPRVVIGSAAAAAELGGGQMLLSLEEPPPRPVPLRRILVLPDMPAGGGVRDWLAEGAHARVLELRGQAAGAGAHELVLIVDPKLGEDDLRALGTVVVPSLRASARDVRAISTDAWTWLTRKQNLHAPPA